MSAVCTITAVVALATSSRHLFAKICVDARKLRRSNDPCSTDLTAAVASAARAEEPAASAAPALFRRALTNPRGRADPDPLPAQSPMPSLAPQPTTRSPSSRERFPSSAERRRSLVRSPCAHAGQPQLGYWSDQTPP